MWPLNNKPLGAIAVLSCAGVMAASAAAVATDWLGFRNDGRSVAAAGELPTTWNVETGENVAWQVDLPGRGVSSPVVVDGRVIVTSSSGPKRDRLHITAYDANTGDCLWNRQLWATGRTLVHPTSAVAANTPVSDGELIFAFFSSNDLVALDLDGNVKWIRGLIENYPLAGNDVGMSSSPVVAGDVVVVQSESHAESFVAAYRKADGAAVWQIDRPHAPTWCSPIAITSSVDGRDVQAVVIQAGDGYSVRRADDGTEIWSQGIPCATTPSAVFADYLYLPANGLQAVSYDSAAGEVKSEWSESRLQPGSASPVIHEGRAYVINGGGVLTCSTVGSGKIDWRLRLGGSFWATPVIAGDRLVAINQNGKAYLVAIGDSKDPPAGKLVGECEFGEQVLASPAVVDGGLFVRSYERLWKLQAAAP
ncbi:MAG: PQQ-binding-like beta-propeller repeat protein [Planctomycetales bacterium]|nr:PQQ-binding-like beta-propeller repeat protein [Planctomycetales bacterium]